MARNADVANRDIVVVGASAGGVETLMRLVADIPRDLPAAVFIVLHTRPGGSGLLANILQRVCPMPVLYPEDNALIRPGRIYVAPPDRHMILSRDRIKLSLGPTHNRNRPAVDPLFLSAGNNFGPRVVGVLLTGFLDDGAEGLADIKHRGGYTIVQSPKDAIVPSMPRHALLRIRPDEVLPVAEIPAALDRVCREEIQETAMAQQGNGKSESQPTTLTCPECHGVVNENGRGKEVRFECQVGHSFTPGGLLDAQNDDLERALWAAVRALEEGATLSRKLAQLSAMHKRPHALKLYEANAKAREQHAATLKSILERWERNDRDPELMEGHGEEHPPA